MEAISLTLVYLNLAGFAFHTAGMDRKLAMVNNAIGIFLKGLGKGYNRSQFTLFCQRTPIIKILNAFGIFIMPKLLEILLKDIGYI